MGQTEGEEVWVGLRPPLATRAASALASEEPKRRRSQESLSAASWTQPEQRGLLVT